MQELTNDEFVALEKFAKGLKECFENKKRSFPEPIAQEILDYVIKVIDIHLDLKKLEFDNYVLNQTKEFKEFNETL